ncbi:MAG: hypothetical protein ABI680_16110 [Chthoniobacteraceae bacterium]
MADALASILFISASTGCSRLMGVHDPVTAANAAPETVPFFTLPASASNVGYWDDGYQQKATFNISEEAFLRIFPDQPFTSIIAEVNYDVWSFGDLNNRPQKSYKNQTATAGLIHEETWKNGGGRKIVFDRNRQFCSYDFVRW